ncbi:hypothetical protein STCU_10385 [Strigomonas culicis]|uniref:Uncharacterized protein n=1 Tax=Strigomonas culicis TaxID=28005 RepID=S9V4K8_9TRYP|nr:hypothetical protein STCU_10385 [Strigomonas culicis]|eukprot:EPY17820.1 hypothetical protein STCU_10385 [Strigomonas culicis]
MTALIRLVVVIRDPATAAVAVRGALRAWPPVRLGGWVLAGTAVLIRYTAAPARVRGAPRRCCARRRALVRVRDPEGIPRGVERLLHFAEERFFLVVVVLLLLRRVVAAAAATATGGPAVLVPLVATVAIAALVLVHRPPHHIHELPFHWIGLLYQERERKKRELIL